MRQTLIDFIVWYDSLGGGLFLSLFAVTLALFALHLLLAARGLRGTTRRAAAAHAAVLLAVCGAAAFVRLAYFPRNLQTIGLDAWVVADAHRVLEAGFSSPAQSPRSVAHSVFFGLFLAKSGFSFPGVFYFNFFFSVLFSALAYAVLFLNTGGVFVSALGAVALSALPVTVLTAGGVLDNTLSGTLVMLFFACFYALARRRTAAWLSLASLSAALAGQARQENFMLLPLYALLLLSIARDLPAKLKTRASLLKNLFYCALCLPYGLKQVCNYILFHHGGQQLAAAETSLPSLVSATFIKAAGNGLIWVYDGYNLSLALWALLAFSVWRAARRGESLRDMLPFAGYFAVHLLVFVPASLVADYMRWYSLLPATCLFLAAYILFHRACGARYAAAAAGLLFGLNILRLPDFLDSGDKTAAGATSITQFAQDSFRDKRWVDIIYPTGTSDFFNYVFAGSNGRFCNKRDRAGWNSPEPETERLVGQALAAGRDVLYFPPMRRGSIPSGEGCRLPPGTAKKPAFAFVDKAGNPYTIWRLLPDPPAAPRRRKTGA